MNATTTFETEQAKRYLTMLCKHFSRRVPTDHNGLSGTVEFPFGRCQMTAHESGLTLTASANETAALDQVVDVMTRHLERFAFRENPHLDWQADTAANQESQATRADSK